MNVEKTEELFSYMESLGALPGSDRRRLESMLRESPREGAVVLAAEVEVATLECVLDSAAEPPMALKSALLQRVRSLAEPQRMETKKIEAADLWQSLPVRGARAKVLSRDPNGETMMLLLDLAPGTRFPAHAHRRDEKCYVVSGSFEQAGRVNQAGDFLHALQGSHDEELFTAGGARLLLVVSPVDYPQLS